jgi:D-alanyl-D-alanine carboxypeptidase
MLAKIGRTLIAAAAMAMAAPAAQAGPALLFDSANGMVLYSEDPDDQWHPASLTKIMTAYIAFEAIKQGTITPQTKIGCSELAHSQPPSKVGLPVGSEMTVQTALEALVVKSANDVAVMLAEAISGSEDAFVQRMNVTAARLGMTRTKFVNANGLPADEQVTTARDLARLTTAVLRDYPNYAGLWSMIDTHVGKRRLHTHNKLLLHYEGADGLKTGFICDAGFNMVASATRDGHRLIAVVLGSPTGNDRAERAASLLEHGFQTVGWKALFPAQTIATLPLEPDAKGPVSVRQSVLSWACGNRPRRSVRKHHKRGQAAHKRKHKESSPAPAKKAADAAPVRKTQ